MANEPFLSRCLHSRSARLGRPCSGTFELTPRCNFDCKMCYVHLSAQEQAERGEELTADQWLAIGESACAEGMVFLLLTGGEPTIRPDFMEIYRGLKKLGLLVSINTNGFLLQGELLRQLLDDPPHRINISLYGTSNETYEALCGVPAYDRVLANIKMLREGGIDVKLNMTVTPENAPDMDRVAEQARVLSAHLQTAMYLFPPVRVTGSSAFPQRMDPERVGELEAERLRRKLSERELEELVRTLKDPDDPTEDCPVCRGGRSAFWLTWNGTMLPCGMLPTPFADVLSMGFSAAWRRIRDEVKGLRLPSKCLACRYRSICRVCLAKCYCEKMSFGEPPAYACRMTEALVRSLLCEGVSIQ